MFQERLSKSFSKFFLLIFRFKQTVGQVAGNINPEEIKKQISIIDAMSEEERKNPNLVIEKAAKTRQRIAQSANATVEDVNRLVCFSLLLYLYIRLLDINK
jgi:signal recognition particle GTPase